VRKIFSIIVALGLILGLTMIAAPAAAQVCETEDMADVSLSDDCACHESVYNITWNISASLTEGVHHICVEFPAEMTVPDEFDDGAILVGEEGGTAYEVFGDEVTVDGTTVCFLVPHDLAEGGGRLLVQFTDDAGLENPCVDDDYSLFVWTDRAPDSEPVEGEFTIVPVYSTYTLALDFSATYPGIAYGFVPPFRACGQNDSVDNPSGFNTTFNVTGVGGFFDEFSLDFAYYDEGCAPPCEDVDIWFELVSCPDDEEIHLQLDGVNYTLDVCDITDTVGEFDLETDWEIDTIVDLATNETDSWTGFLHFSSPGDYKLAFYAECPESPCPECVPGGIIAELPAVFNVYQEKNAYKLSLCEKWNLISLPLVPLGMTGSIAISDALASANIPPLEALGAGYGGFFASQVIGAIWYFDAGTGTWLHWTASTADTDTLTTLEDGKAYWVYVGYPLTTAIDNVLYALAGPGYEGTAAGLFTLFGVDPCCGAIDWWVWGTKMPVPYNPPSAYDVVEGWNMVGFTSLTGLTPEEYLWNWSAPNPVVYGYTKACWNLQSWDLLSFNSTDMAAGSGYWIAFPEAGTIYVP